MSSLFHPVVSRGAQRVRKGAAAVELAVCLPVLMLLTMATLEATDLVFLRQRLVTAAFEAARTATAPGQTSAGGIASGTNILTARGITGGNVSISPTVLSNTATGTQVNATVTAPFATNSYMEPFLFGSSVSNVTVTVTMVRQ